MSLPPPPGPPPAPGPPPSPEPQGWGPPPPPPTPPGWTPQPAPARRSRALPVALAVVAAVLVVLGAVLVPLVLLGDDDDPVEVAGSASATPDTADLDQVRVYDGLDPTHVEGDVTYEQSPPVGGNHSPTWLDCGTYDEPVREENVVHDLEHGTVWITYRDDLVDEDGVRTLGDQLPRNGILSPYPDQAAPVVITVWGRQLELVGPQDPRIGLFIDEFGAGETAPEPFASCAGGVRDPDGGHDDGTVIG